MYLSQTNGDLFVYYGNSIEKTIEHLSKAGFRYVDVSFFTRFQKGSIYFSDDYMKVVEEYKAAFEKYGVKPMQSHEPTGNSLGDDGGEYYMKKTPRAIEMAAKMGCESITIHPGNSHIKISRDEAIEKNIAAIKKLLPYAEKYGIKLLFENCGDFLSGEDMHMKTADDLIAVVDGVGSDYLGICWDVGHANGNMLDPYDEIKKIGGRLGGVHLHDNIGFTHVDFNGKRITGDLHTMPLSFDVDYDKVMRALIETGYKGTFNFEVDSPKKVIPFTEGREELMDYARAVRLAADTYLYKTGELILGKYNLYEG